MPSAAETPTRWRGDVGDLPFAESRAAVAELLSPTPLVEDERLSERAGVAVHLKLENLQITGSFKARGAVARLSALTEAERARGVVACSSGNHGKAVAWVAGRLGVPATICVPDWVDPVKLEAIRAEGARAVLSGPSYDAAAERAHALAAEGRTLVHPFDDPWVLAGQGTVATEILDQRPDVATVVAPLAGGGLVGGVAATLRAENARAKVVAASAERARVMVESLRAGRPVEMPEEETVASALSGGIELENRWTFGIVRDLVERHVVVGEEAIGRAMAYAYRSLDQVVEGGGAVGLAALLEGHVPGSAAGLGAADSEAGSADGPPEPPREREAGPIVVVISGGNVAKERLSEVLEARPVE